MSSTKNILSFVFLGIYSMVLLHGMLPAGHFHDSISEHDSHVEGESHHHHDHHHGEKDHEHSHHQSHYHDFENNWVSSVLHLLGDLLHHDEGDEHIEFYYAENLQVKTFKKDRDFDSEFLSGRKGENLGQVYSNTIHLYKDEIPIKTFLVLAFPYRGPPMV